MEEEEQQEGFKVKDRRRFDSSGNLRSEEVNSTSPSTSSLSTSSPSASSPSPGTSQSEREEGSEHPEFVMSEKESKEAFAKHGEGSIDFSSFVLSLATQAMVQLGEMPSPQGASIPKDVQAARQTIEILGMFQERTRGNLSEAEESMMQEILHNLRLAYVQRVS